MTAASRSARLSIPELNHQRTDLIDPAGPRGSRNRQQLLGGAAERLSDAELLAALLCGPDPQAQQKALQWLRQCGGLRALLNGDPQQLGLIRGLGPARQARLIASIELGRRFLETAPPKRQPLRNPQDAAACFKARLADLPHEVFGCVYLDTRHRIICYEPLFRGTIDGTVVYPREVLKRALHHNAAAIIVGHNHPSGDCEPSQADRNLTQRLKKSLALVDIRLLDHLIVARGECRSLAELGWL